MLNSTCELFIRNDAEAVRIDEAPEKENGDTTMIEVGMIGTGLS